MGSILAKRLSAILSRFVVIIPGRENRALPMLKSVEANWPTTGKRVLNAFNANFPNFKMPSITGLSSFLPKFQKKSTTFLSSFPITLSGKKAIVAMAPLIVEATFVITAPACITLLAKFMKGSAIIPATSATTLTNPCASSETAMKELLSVLKMPGASIPIC